MLGNLNRKLLLTRVAAASLVAAGGYLSLRTPDVGGKPQPTRTTVVGEREPTKPVQVATDARTVTSPASPASLPHETRGAMLERLMKGSPTEQVQAFQILTQCARARIADANNVPAETRLQVHLGSVAQECDGVLAGQEVARLPLLAKAAEALAPGAMDQVMWTARGQMEQEEFKVLFGRAIELNAKAGDKAAVALKTFWFNLRADPTGAHPETAITTAQWLAIKGDK
jgi:hypothetical protein